MVTKNYTDKLMDYFLNPRNMGEIPNPDGEAIVGNPVCGDVMKMMIKVGKRMTKDNKEEEYITDVKFKTLGCAAAVATSSMVTELVKGQSLGEALKITNKAVTEALGGLPANKYHCSVLAEEAIQRALENYEAKKTRNSKHGNPKQGFQKNSENSVYQQVGVSDKSDKPIL